MKVQVKRFSILQSSKIATILYVIFGCFYTLIGIPLAIFGEGNTRIMGVIYIFGPVWMGLFGFIAIVIMFGLYNGLATLVGGIEFEIEDVGNPARIPPELSV